MHTKLGHKLRKGDPILTLFSEDEHLLDGPEEMLRDTLQIAAAPPTPRPLIREVLTKANLSTS